MHAGNPTQGNLLKAVDTKFQLLTGQSMEMGYPESGYLMAQFTNGLGAIEGPGRSMNARLIGLGCLADPRTDRWILEDKAQIKQTRNEAVSLEGHAGASFDKQTTDPMATESKGS